MPGWQQKARLQTRNDAKDKGERGTEGREKKRRERERERNRREKKRDQLIVESLLQRKEQLSMSL